VPRLARAPCSRISGCQLSGVNCQLRRQPGPATLARVIPSRARNLLFASYRIMPNAGFLTYNGRVMKFEDYKIVLYRQDDRSGWVAEIPAIPSCYALMTTREAALSELANVFDMIAETYRERGIPLPADTTEIVNA